MSKRRVRLQQMGFPNDGRRRTLFSVYPVTRRLAYFAAMLGMAKKKTPIRSPYPERSKDAWVTQSMLYATRDELKNEIKSLRHEMNSKFEELGGLVRSLSEHIKSRFHAQDAEIQRMLALYEEQNARNAIVFDGLTSLFGRQDRVEKRVDDVEKTMADFRR
jgi:hypothetical protein